MRRPHSRSPIARLVLVIAAIALPLAFAGSAFAQDDGQPTKKVKVMVKKHVECDGDDCEDALHTVHSGMHGGQGANVMVFRSDDVGNGDDKHVWVSSDGGEFSFGGGAFLGVQMIELTDALRNRFDVRDGVGVMVSEVVAGSPAEAAGILAGDIITAVDGEEISGSTGLTRKMRQFAEGENVAFEISSDGSTRVVNATLAKRESGIAMLRSFSPDISDQLMRVRSKFAGGDNNVFVHKCDEDSGDCDVETIIERVVGDHDDAHVIELNGVDFDGLDCGDSDNCQIEVSCENDACVCTVNGTEVACGN